MRTMGAAKFKAQCLSILDEVQNKRQPVLLTKSGKPIAKLIPLEFAEGEDPLDRYHYAGILGAGDVISPFYTDGELQEFEHALMGSIK